MTEQAIPQDDEGTPPPGGFGGFITRVCTGLTNACGSEWCFIAVMIWLIVVYVFLPIDGYARWNLGIGLFSNSNGSNLELVTGVGSMVMIRSIRKHQAESRRHQHRHAQELARLHERFDELVHREHRAPPAGKDGQP